MPVLFLAQQAAFANRPNPETPCSPCPGREGSHKGCPCGVCGGSSPSPPTGSLKKISNLPGSAQPAGEYKEQDAP
ncbi:MAG: hypothetical protein MUC60_06030 [Oscillatoria sp. Prado101]|nr:hypothetical protein [Oscillatoria sp. Prado101]